MHDPRPNDPPDPLVEVPYSDTREAQEAAIRHEDEPPYLQPKVVRQGSRYCKHCEF